MVAKQYFIHALQNGARLHVSTLALAEFAIKQPLEDLTLHALLVLPFNIDHASACGRLGALLLPARDAGDDRAIMRTDLQLIAQAHVESIPCVLTEDRRTLSKYLDRARAAGACACQAVVLADGFDAAWFNDGQRALALPEGSS